MSEDYKYTERDLKLAEDLGGIKTLQKTILEKLTEYCANDERQHNAMWKRIDWNHRKINWMLGGVGVAGFSIGGVLVWMKNKLGF